MSEALRTQPGRFKRYPAYKDSGVEWLGETPLHWEAKRLKRIFRVVNGSTPQSSEPEYWDGDIPWVTPEDLGDLSGTEIQSTKRSITQAGYHSCGTTLVPAGSLVLSTRAPIGHLAVAGVDLCTNQGCRSLVFRAPQARKFFFYHLLAVRPELEAQGQGSTFKELAKDKLEDVFIAEPPVSEQRAIATFLDRETAKIDALVAQKERLIGLLREKRTALITRAVTKGLDPNVRMKDSGVEWLGEIPAHWGLMQLGQGMQLIMDFRGRTPLKLGMDWGGEIPAISAVNVREGHLDLSRGVNYGAQALHDRWMAQGPTRLGDVVFTTEAPLGNVALLPDESQYILSQRVVLLRPSPLRITPEYLQHFLGSLAFRQGVEGRATGSTAEGVKRRHLMAMPVCMPPLGEQRAISTFVDHRTSKIEALAPRVGEAVNRLKEFRTALISSAVTGKIDVREEGAAGPPP